MLNTIILISLSLLSDSHLFFHWFHVYTSLYENGRIQTDGIGTSSPQESPDNLFESTTNGLGLVWERELEVGDWSLYDEKHTYIIIFQFFVWMRSTADACFSVVGLLFG